MRWLLLLLLACGGSAPPAPKEAPATQAVVPKSVVPPATTPAPTLAWNGLTLGTTDAAGIESWLQGKGLACAGAPSVRRLTVRYVCEGELPSTLLPDRTITGKITQLLLARTDAGPLHHASTRRNYSLPEGAIADYNGARASLVAVFGEPRVGKAVPDGTVLTDRPVWYNSVWSFKDLEVQLSLMRMAGASWSVGERWDVPGVEAEVETRGPSGVDASATPTEGRDPYGFDKLGLPNPHKKSGG